MVPSNGLSQLVATGIDTMAQHARESLKFMLGDELEPNQSTKESQWWEAGPHMEPCDVEPRAPCSQDTQSSCITMAPTEVEVQELSALRANSSQLRQTLSMVGKQSSPWASAAAPTATPYDYLLSSHALLKRRLMEAEEIHVPSAMATARACAADAEQLRMTNRKLEEKLQEVEKVLGSKIFASSALALREAEDLRAQNMKLQQQLLASEKCWEENTELRRTLAETESHMMVLADGNKNLRVQLSTQFKKCADAESQRTVQKQLFCTGLETAKHDMGQCDDHHVKAVTRNDHAARGEYWCDGANQTHSRAEHVNVSGQAPCTKYIPNDESANANVAQASLQYLLPRHSSCSPIQRYSGQPCTEASPVARPRRPRSTPRSAVPEHDQAAANMQPAELVLNKFVKTLDSSLRDLKKPHSRSPLASAKSAITPNFCREIGRLALLQRTELESDRHRVFRQRTAPSQLETSYRKLMPLRAAIAPETQVHTAGL